VDRALAKVIADEGTRIDTQLQSRAQAGLEAGRLTQKELFDSTKPKIYLQVSCVTPLLTGKTIERVQLMCSGGAGNLIFRALAKNKAKVIGHEELDFVLENHTLSVFPRDFPATNAFEGHKKAVEQARVKKYLLFPDNKKFDYFSNSFPFPFELGFPSDDPQQLAVYRFRMLGTGNIRDNAMIFVPIEADLVTLVQTQPCADPLWADILNFQPSEDTWIREKKVQGDHSFAKIEDYRLFLQENVICSRQPVGKVLGGRFNYTWGRNAGTFCARNEALEKAFADQANFFQGKSVRDRRVVLIRNHNSFDYHWAAVIQS
jgi:hypothetical protein